MEGTRDLGTYRAPEIEVLEMIVEKGFATSAEDYTTREGGW